VTVVIDASIATAWLFDDEAGPATDAIADRVESEGALVPGHFRLEVANILIQAERRSRIEAADATRRLELLMRLPIRTDAETDGRAWRETSILARTEKLTSYDAAYLELAQRSGSALATLDKELAVAARRLGVAVVP
jgi:predicted nucleic acid-binding protein